MGCEPWSQGHPASRLCVRQDHTSVYFCAHLSHDSSSKAKRVIENSHAADVKLSEEENAEIWNIIKGHEIKGGRYADVDPKLLHLWG